MWWGGGEGGPLAQEAMRQGASQDPWELGCAIARIRELDPRIILEIGCDQGGTLYAWTQIADQVIGITTEDNTYDSGGSGKLLRTHGAHVLIGDSHDAASLDWVMRGLECRENPAVAHQIDALVIDGDHHLNGVLADVADYGPLVRPGGLILLHDITYSPDPRAEVWKAWPSLAARFTTSEIRNPGGGYGWGVIEVSDGDDFGSLAPGAASRRSLLPGPVSPPGPVSRPGWAAPGRWCPHRRSSVTATTGP